MKPLVRSALKSPVNSKVKTILVVDDEEGIRCLLSGYFRRQGYRVLEASNSAEAFHICQTEPGGVQILMTDINMPGVSGLALAEQILLSHPGIRVIYMSGALDEDTFRRLAGNADRTFIQKPFTLQAVGCRVREILGAQGWRSSP